jgi:hypothetical protein
MRRAPQLAASVAMRSITAWHRLNAGFSKAIDSIHQVVVGFGQIAFRKWSTFPISLYPRCCPNLSPSVLS